MALALNNLKRVDMPLSKETKPYQPKSNLLRKKTDTNVAVKKFDKMINTSSIIFRWERKAEEFIGQTFMLKRTNWRQQPVRYREYWKYFSEVMKSIDGIQVGIFGKAYLLKAVFFKNRPELANYKKSKVGDRSRGQPEGSLFNSYYTKV